MSSSKPFFPSQQDQQVITTVKAAVEELIKGLGQNESGILKMLTFMETAKKDGIQDLIDAQKYLAEINTAINKTPEAQMTSAERSAVGLFRDKVKGLNETENQPQSVNSDPLKP